MNKQQLKIIIKRMCREEENSFVRFLGYAMDVCQIKGDTTNLYKIVTAFPELMMEYKSDEKGK